MAPHSVAIHLEHNIADKIQCNVSIYPPVEVYADNINGFHFLTVSDYVLAEVLAAHHVSVPNMQISVIEVPVPNIFFTDPSMHIIDLN